MKLKELKIKQTKENEWEIDVPFAKFHVQKSLGSLPYQVVECEKSFYTFITAVAFVKDIIEKEIKKFVE